MAACSLLLSRSEVEAMETLERDILINSTAYFSKVQLSGMRA